MLHSFTRNHNDLSSDAGFQFEFFCDNCGNGYKSSFLKSSTYHARKKNETVSRGAGLLGGLFGGIAGDLGNAVENGLSSLGSRFDTNSPQWRKEQ